MPPLLLPVIASKAILDILNSTGAVQLIQIHLTSGVARGIGHVEVPLLHFILR